jgi:hypothetical protein
VGAVAAESLRDELAALPGVAEVELDGEGSVPAGVRIRLAVDADPDRVGVEVQRVLAAHGMRSRVDGSAVAPPPLPLAVPAPPPEEEPALLARAGTPAVLQAVRVEESASAVAVTVIAGDGRQVTRDAEWSEEGMAAAAIEAVGLLLEGALPRVVAVDWLEADGSRVVTVVLDSAGGDRGAGAAVVRVSRAFAVARAAWSALGG